MSTNKSERDPPQCGARNPTNHLCCSSPARCARAKGTRCKTPMVGSEPRETPKRHPACPAARGGRAHAGPNSVLASPTSPLSRLNCCFPKPRRAASDSEGTGESELGRGRRPRRSMEVDPAPGEDQDRPVRVYADGIYDLFHFGHARSLEQAKKLFPNTYLLVGCCSDEVTHKYKGKTVMTEDERYESLRHCRSISRLEDCFPWTCQFSYELHLPFIRKHSQVTIMVHLYIFERIEMHYGLTFCRWVDEVIPDAPWVITQEFLDKHKIDYVAHDSLPYADASGAGKDVYEFVKAVGKFKETKRTEGISTSDLIMRMLKDYNQYVMRNLARGYTRKDLGVSYEKRLRVNMELKKFREKVKEQQEKVGEKLSTVAKTAGVMHDTWVDNADRWVVGFLEKFEEHCHIMGTAIRDRIQEGLKRQQSRGLSLLQYDEDDDDDEFDDCDEDEYEEEDTTGNPR
ncbi:hypothetical protein Taro_015675 [Colocasia esculenta]|uniref:choline-phosphate cytidylyltransferase n=1 Tax=Colocasia esculenta TaxID=4460 RepID=A0A843ULI1_COLES|nr:hypothetical protein [Colocasia esculenta]